VVPHSSLGFQRPVGRRSYRLTPQACLLSNLHTASRGILYKRLLWREYFDYSATDLGLLSYWRCNLRSLWQRSYCLLSVKYFSTDYFNDDTASTRGDVVRPIRCCCSSKRPKTSLKPNSIILAGLELAPNELRTGSEPAPNQLA